MTAGPAPAEEKSLIQPARVNLIHDDMGSYHAPAHIASAVEMFARENGRHARIEFIEAMDCWVVRFELNGNDPRLKAWQKHGYAAPEPTEDVFLQYWSDRGYRDLRDNRWRPGYRSYRLMDLGVEGVLDFLRKTNVASGRGDFTGVKALERHRKESWDQGRAAAKQDAKSEALALARDVRRQVLGIPLITAGIDLQKEKDQCESTT